MTIEKMHDASGRINRLPARDPVLVLVMPAFCSPPASAALRYKTAHLPEEYEAIHRLNHQTFATEIPQHDPQDDGRLVDRFHESNCYQIALHGEELAGMVALRFERPFSVEQKIPESMADLPAGARWCEIRLLAIANAWRGGAVLAGLLRRVIEEVAARGCDAGLISATTRQLKLYQHLGFTAFGPLIGRDGAWYQPMWVTMERLAQRVPWLSSRGPDPVPPVNLLPGPVTLIPAVREAFAGDPVSHRGPLVLQQVQEIRQALTHLTGASFIALLSGGGTLANDVIAAQLRLTGDPGIVVDSGEFGRRLTDQATRAGLDFQPLCLTPETDPLPALESFLTQHPQARWLWITHCETSTGQLFPLTEIATCCARRGIRLCVDAVSTLGVVPVDLRHVWMASGASGKGLGAYPGIGLVLANQPAPSSAQLPRALDLSRYQEADGMPSTLGSNLIAALHAALHHTDWARKIHRLATHSPRLRQHLADAGLPLLPGAGPWSPAVITLQLPPGLSSRKVGMATETDGYLLAWQSPWLQARNQIQICLMGAWHPRDTRRLPQALAQHFA
jgi:aspartate aminotransferase-like enzyme/GNAT superfamily N-acetyltransferase